MSDILYWLKALGVVMLIIAAIYAGIIIAIIAAVFVIAFIAKTIIKANNEIDVPP